MRADFERRKFTPPQLARQWGVGPDKITWLIRSGKLPAINVSRGKSGKPRYLIDVADVERCEELLRVTPREGTA